MLYHSSFLQELRRKIGSIEMAIGENCAKLISDSDTLQLGIGSNELYRFIHNNSSINMMPAVYVNNPLKIMKN